MTTLTMQVMEMRCAAGFGCLAQFPACVPVHKGIDFKGAG